MFRTDRPPTDVLVCESVAAQGERNETQHVVCNNGTTKLTLFPDAALFEQLEPAPSDRVVPVLKTAPPPSVWEQYRFGAGAAAGTLVVPALMWLASLAGVERAERSLDDLLAAAEHYDLQGNRTGAFWGGAAAYVISSGAGAAGNAAGKVIPIRAAKPKGKARPLIRVASKKPHELPQLFEVRELEAQGHSTAVALLRKLQGLVPKTISAHLKMSSDGTHVYIGQLAIQPGPTQAELISDVCKWLAELNKRIPKLLFDHSELKELFSRLTAK